MTPFFLPLNLTLVVGRLCYNGMLEQMLRCSDFNYLFYELHFLPMSNSIFHGFDPCCVWLLCCNGM